MYTYLLINFFTILIPFFYSFEKRINFISKWKYVFPATICTGIPFLIWDHYFTKQGIWGFNESYLLGIYFYELPLEEILFFVCIPFSCLFIYESLRYFMKRDYAYLTSKLIVYLLIGLVATLGLCNLDKAYTSTVCLSASIYLFLLFTFVRPHYLGIFHISYFVTILPFLLVNGILTRGLRAIDYGPVVWYNNAENLGIRIFTIPAEDFVYCYFLLLVNVGFYEWFKKKNNS